METSQPKESCFYLNPPAAERSECAPVRRLVFTGLALTAFASNSILCRLALGHALIDAAGFTMLRLTSGAVALWLITAAIAAKPASAPAPMRSLVSAAFLFLYAVAFSFAYINLNTGTGALILFGSVQATMFIAAVIGGQKPNPYEYVGLLVALGGLAYLVFPGLNTPPLWAAGLMMAAGTAWGIYSLRGRSSKLPIVDTRNNFLYSLPFVLLLGLVAFPFLQVSPKGVLFAVISGAGASATGYIIWYAALQNLNAKHAALVQLLVPPLAATGGVLFLAEPLSWRLVGAAALILGGIATAIFSTYRGLKNRSS